MFNLLVSYNKESWDSGVYNLPKERFCEYTDSDIRLRYLNIPGDTKNELKSYPCLFVVENEAVDTRIGYITDIKNSDGEIKIKFELSSNYKPLPAGSFEKLRMSFDMDKLEIYRTHWAIKDVALFKALENKGLLNSHTLSTEETVEAVSSEKDIFIVHGHDSIFKLEVSKFIEELGLKPIVLDEQPNSGSITIIEKIEHYSSAKFGIVLYSECDIGYEQKEHTLPQLKYRARQNVVFEHGYLIGKLGRERVLSIVKGEVEMPSDISGIVYVEYSFTNEKWKEDIKKALKKQGINF